MLSCHDSCLDMTPRCFLHVGSPVSGLKLCSVPTKTVPKATGRQQQCLRASMAFVLRRGVVEDAAQIVALAREQLGDTSLVREGVKAALTDEAKGRYYVAEEGGKIMAALFIVCGLSHWTNSSMWWVQQVAVSQEKVDQAFLDALFERLREESKKEGVLHLHLIGWKYTSSFIETCQRNGMKSDYDIHEETFTRDPL